MPHVTDVKQICRLLMETIELNDVDLVSARVVLMWMGIELMKKEGFNTDEIWQELEAMKKAHKQLNVNLCE